MAIQSQHRFGKGSEIVIHDESATRSLCGQVSNNGGRVMAQQV